MDKIDYSKAKKMYTPVNGQLSQYRLEYFLMQTGLAIFLIFGYLKKFHDSMLTDSVTLSIVIVIIFLLYLKNYYLLKAKDIYAVYLFEDKLFFFYVANLSFGLLKKHKQVPFDDLKEFVFSSISGGYIFSRNSYNLFFEFVKAEDFSFMAIPSKQMEPMCQEIKAQWEEYKKEHNIPEYDIFKTDLPLPTYLHKK